MAVPPRKAVKKVGASVAKSAPAKAAPAAKDPNKLRSAGGAKKYDFPMQQYVEKEPTALHRNFAAWLKEQTGYEVDEKTLQLAVVLRINFQRSQANQEDLSARRSASAEKTAAKPVVKAGPKRRPVGKKAVEETEEVEAVEAVEDPADAVEEVEEAPAPKKAPVRRATKTPAKTPVKAGSGTPPRARKTATPKASASEEEAF